MNKHLQPIAFFYGRLPNRFSDLQKAYEVCVCALVLTLRCLIRGTENPKQMNLRPVKIGSTCGQHMVDGGAML
jgi:hypothetical protein